MITFEYERSTDGKSLVVHYDRVDEEEYLAVLMEAAAIFGERNAKYKDNWRRQGWRGPLYDLRRKVERIWDEFWDKSAFDPADDEEPKPHVDDALDVINYGAITVRAIRAGDRDGAWW